MKKLIFYTAIMAAFFFSSCVKDKGFGEAFTYGKVQVQNYPLPDIPAMDLFYNGKQIVDWNGVAFPVQANTASRISIYVSGTHELVADTTVTIAHDETMYLRVTYSQELGIKGFYSGQQAVPADSARFRFKYTLNQVLYPFPDVDLYIFRSTDTTASGLLTIVNHISFGSGYSPAITLPAFNEQGGLNIFFVKMKDRLSGEFIREKHTRHRDYVIVYINEGGSFNVVELTDNRTDEATNKFQSIAFTL
jgi:hypothetical protein